ncbi:MAG: hypothetical protein J3K34DRAFT_516108 [Monoraphidium minutum]|nr:MAG: hypothetical protein J3K34DRAFT_516108 [Monoraphidium minutum]
MHSLHAKSELICDPIQELESVAGDGGGGGGGGGTCEELAALAAPAVSLQPPLTAKERAALRAESEQLARDKKLVQVQSGAAGITPAVLSSLMDVLVKRSFVRLRCGSSGKERQAVAKQLERLLDAAAVHSIGRTITLYRQPGLARPQGCSCSPLAGAAPQ